MALFLPDQTIKLGMMTTYFFNRNQIVLLKNYAKVLGLKKEKLFFPLTVFHDYDIFSNLYTGRLCPTPAFAGMTK